jgi:hypothetical protein
MCLVTLVLFCWGFLGGRQDVTGAGNQTQGLVESCACKGSALALSYIPSLATALSLSLSLFFFLIYLL